MKQNVRFLWYQFLTHFVKRSGTTQTGRLNEENKEKMKRREKKIGNKQSREFPLKETFTAYFKYLRKTEYKFLNLFFGNFFIFEGKQKCSFLLVCPFICPNIQLHLQDKWKDKDTRLRQLRLHVFCDIFFISQTERKL